MCRPSLFTSATQTEEPKAPAGVYCSAMAPVLQSESQQLVN